ncbi:hypothetical protein RB594_001004 [Gaeumannomyces avenae]
MVMAAHLRAYCQVLSDGGISGGRTDREIDFLISISIIHKQHHPLHHQNTLDTTSNPPNNNTPVTTETQHAGTTDTMKYETFAAFLISVALPTLAYPAGSSIAGLDADAAIEQRGEGATIEQRDPKQPAHPYPHILRPGFRGPWPVGMPIRPFPKVAGRSDAEVERREPNRGRPGKPNNNQQPGGAGRTDKITNVLNTVFPWVDMVQQQQQPPAKRSELAIEQRAPRGPKGKPNNNQQPGGPGKVDTITNVINTAFPWVDMFTNQQQPQKRSDAPSDAEIADMLEAAAAGYLDERQAQVVRRAVVAAILA